MMEPLAGSTVAEMPLSFKVWLRERIMRERTPTRASNWACWSSSWACCASRRLSMSARAVSLSPTNCRASSSSACFWASSSSESDTACLARFSIICWLARSF